RHAGSHPSRPRFAARGCSGVAGAGGRTAGARYRLRPALAGPAAARAQGAGGCVQRCRRIGLELRPRAVGPDGSAAGSDHGRGERARPPHRSAAGEPGAANGAGCASARSAAGEHREQRQRHGGGGARRDARARRNRHLDGHGRRACAVGALRAGHRQGARGASRRHRPIARPRHRPADPIGMRQRATAAVAITLSLLCLVQAFGPQAQWDLRIWLAMGHAFREGRTPYVNPGDGLFFVYPPIAAPLLAPLSLLSLRAATAVWLLLKLIAFSGLIAIWRRFVEIRGSALEVLYFLFAFGSALSIDLISGNPGMFEQLGIWLGLLALSRGRIAWFCIAIVVTAQLKIAPALMLLALLAIPEKPRWGAFGLSAGGFLAMLGLQRVIAPEWFAEFVRRSAGVDERGPSNPALVALI